MSSTSAPSVKRSEKPFVPRSEGTLSQKVEQNLREAAKKNRAQNGETREGTAPVPDGLHHQNDYAQTRKFKGYYNQNGYQKNFRSQPRTQFQPRQTNHPQTQYHPSQQHGPSHQPKYQPVAGKNLQPAQTSGQQNVKVPLDLQFDSATSTNPVSLPLPEFSAKPQTSTLEVLPVRTKSAPLNENEKPPLFIPEKNPTARPALPSSSTVQSPQPAHTTSGLLSTTNGSESVLSEVNVLSVTMCADNDSENAPQQPSSSPLPLPVPQIPSYQMKQPSLPLTHQEQTSGPSHLKTDPSNNSSPLTNGYQNNGQIHNKAPYNNHNHQNHNHQNHNHQNHSHQNHNHQNHNHQNNQNNIQTLNHFSSSSKSNPRQIRPLTPLSVSAETFTPSQHHNNYHPPTSLRHSTSPRLRPSSLSQNLNQSIDYKNKIKYTKDFLLGLSKDSPPPPNPISVELARNSPVPSTNGNQQKGGASGGPQANGAKANGTGKAGKAQKNQKNKKGNAKGNKANSNNGQQSQNVVNNMGPNNNMNPNTIGLVHAENRWVPPSLVKEVQEVDQKEKLIRKVRSLLNKITVERFTELSDQIVNVGITTAEVLMEVINSTFEKAISEPHFANLYADLCRKLIMSCPSFPDPVDPSKKITSKRILLNQCQVQFEKKTSPPPTSQDFETKCEEEKEEIRFKERRKTLGNIKLIGELFKLKLVPSKIIHSSIIPELIKIPDSDKIEGFCKLIKTIGKTLEDEEKQSRLKNCGNLMSINNNSALSSSPPPPDSFLSSSPPQFSPISSSPPAILSSSPPGSLALGPSQNLDTYFQTVENLSRDPSFDSRIRFMLQDLLELRRNQWVPRREETVAKTIKEIHEEALVEESSSSASSFGRSRFDQGGKPSRGGKSLLPASLPSSPTKVGYIPKSHDPLLSPPPVTWKQRENNQNVSQQSYQAPRKALFASPSTSTPAPQIQPSSSSSPRSSSSTPTTPTSSPPNPFATGLVSSQPDSSLASSSSSPPSPPLSSSSSSSSSSSLPSFGSSTFQVDESTRAQIEQIFEEYFVSYETSSTLIELQSLIIEQNTPSLSNSGGASLSPRPLSVTSPLSALIVYHGVLQSLEGLPTKSNLFMQLILEAHQSQPFTPQNIVAGLRRVGEEMADIELDNPKAPIKYRELIYQLIENKSIHLFDSFLIYSNSNPIEDQLKKLLEFLAFAYQKSTEQFDQLYEQNNEMVDLFQKHVERLIAVQLPFSDFQALLTPYFKKEVLVGILAFFCVDRVFPKENALLFQLLRTNGPETLGNPKSVRMLIQIWLQTKNFNEFIQNYGQGRERKLSHEVEEDCNFLKGLIQTKTYQFQVLTSIEKLLSPQPLLFSQIIPLICDHQICSFESLTEWGQLNHRSAEQEQSIKNILLSINHRQEHKQTP